MAGLIPVEKLELFQSLTTCVAHPKIFFSCIFRLREAVPGANVLVMTHICVKVFQLEKLPADLFFIVQ